MQERGKKVIQINFDNFDEYKDNRTIIKFEMMDKEKFIIDDNNVTKYKINLELIKRKYYNKDVMSKLEK